MATMTKKYIIMILLILFLLVTGLLYGLPFGSGETVPVAYMPGSGTTESNPPQETIPPETAPVWRNDLEYEFTGSITLSFSETEHFFDRSISVSIISSYPDAFIYYTLDGSEPTEHSAQHKNDIVLHVGARVRAVVIRAIAVYDTYITQVYTHTYFLGPSVFERFGDEMLIFSVVSEPYGLFDYYSGIMVPGFLRDQFIAENPGRNIIPPDPANYNWRGREGERPASVEVFTPNGERVIAQNAGLRVHGAWSRDYDQKSLRLIPRREYSPETGRFRYPFFPGDLVQDGTNNPITRYETLVLRNGGNDRDFGMLRNEVGSVLAREVGLHVVTPVRPAAVFLNGDYWGFAWLQVRIDPHYLQIMYNAPTREFDVVSIGELSIETDCPIQRQALEYKNSYANKDLLDDAVFARLEAILDIEDMLRYYAFMIFMGNEDWPHNNLRRWRYTGEQTEGLPPQLDGRWRYVLFDLDWTLGLYGANYNLPTFRRVLEERNGAGALLRNVLTRPDMMARFSEIMGEIADTITASHVSDTISLLYGWIDNEIDRALSANKYSNWVNRRTIRDNHDNMVRFAAGRRAVMEAGLARISDI
jgi:hypothetical protein